MGCESASQSASSSPWQLVLSAVVVVRLRTVGTAERPVGWLSSPHPVKVLSACNPAPDTNSAARLWG